MSPRDHVTPGPERGGRRLVRLAWLGAVVVMAALLLGGAIVAAATAARPSPHTVLDARFATGDVPSATDQRDSFELWTDPTLGRARLYLAREGITLYYVRDASGAWYSIGRASSHEPWRRVRLPTAAAPSLLGLEGVRALFAHLRARAPHVTGAGIRNRMAVAFPATALSWPYRYAGRTTVWLDAVTGLPLQFRITVPHGASGEAIITAVNRIRAVPSSALPSGFFTPPDEHPSAWDALVSRVAGWIQQGRN